MERLAKISGQIKFICIVSRLIGKYLKRFFFLDIMSDLWYFKIPPEVGDTIFQVVDCFEMIIFWAFLRVSITRKINIPYLTRKR